MLGRIRPRLTYANVASSIALFIALGTGGAYAADTIGSADIIDESILSQDIKNGEVKTSDLGGAAVSNGKLGTNAVGTGKVLDESLTALDLGPASVGTSEIADAAIANADLAAGAVDSAGVLDSSLTGTDILSSSLTGSDVANSSLTGSDVLDESMGGTEISDASLTGADVAASSLTGSDIADDSITATDIDGANRSGSIDVGAISNGRCTTITGSVSGAEPGDIAVLTTNGSLPNGVMVYAQRALTNQVHIKVCNLSGATSAAITDLPVRVMTFR